MGNKYLTLDDFGKEMDLGDRTTIDFYIKIKEDVQEIVNMGDIFSEGRKYGK